VLKGSLVALVTPFDDHNRVDYTALKRLIEFHVAEGSNGLVIAGTTGESATLDTEEHIELIGRAVESRYRVEFYSPDGESVGRCA
jgi:4-hydroxy-tetrahydrodipicolinate synthase